MNHDEELSLKEEQVSLKNRELKTKTEELSTKEKELRLLQGKNQDQASSIKNLEIHLGQAKSDMSRLTKEVQLKEEKLDSKQEELKVKHKDLESLRLANNELQDENQDLASIVKDLETQQVSAQERLDELVLEKSQLQQVLAATKSDSEREIKTLNAKIFNFRQDQVCLLFHVKSHYRLIYRGMGIRISRSRIGVSRCDGVVRSVLCMDGCVCVGGTHSIKLQYQRS